MSDVYSGLVRTLATSSERVLKELNCDRQRTWLNAPTKRFCCLQCWLLTMHHCLSAKRTDATTGRVHGCMKRKRLGWVVGGGGEKDEIFRFVSDLSALGTTGALLLALQRCGSMVPFFVFPPPPTQVTCFSCLVVHNNTPLELRGVLFQCVYVVTESSDGSITRRSHFPRISSFKNSKTI